MHRWTFAAVVLLGAAAPAFAQNPAPDDPARRGFQQRAVEAVVWGMPAVNYELMRQAAVRAKAADNQIVYWPLLPDWKNQTLTPNPDVVYLLAFFNTREAGPIVLEIPPADDGVINGTVMDSWQVPLEDVGPAGADKGKGGKYLVLPPGYKDKAPAGTIPLQSQVTQGYALLRSILKSGSSADIAKAVAYAKRIKLYPLKQAAKPPATVFVDVADTVFDSTIPYNLRYFRALDRIVQAEPWLERDKPMVEVLKSIGIEKGKPFKPDIPTQQMLQAAAREAQSVLRARYENAFSPPFYPGTRWALPATAEYIKAAESGFAQSYPVDARGLVFTFAFFTAKKLGEGQFYLMTIKDRAGQALDGGKTYRLLVPPNVPVKQYWSATVYDRATHALIRDQKRVGRSSQSPGLQKSADGSVELFFGPRAPAGKEPNWVPTRAGGQFEVLFRFYGPDQSFFDKKWKLADIEAR